MTDQKTVVCKANLQANPLRLLAIWLFLLILPVFLMTVVSEEILSESETLLQTTAKLNLTHELQDFKEKLSFSRLLDSELMRLRKTCPQTRSNSGATEVSEQIQNFMGIKVTALFYYDADNDMFSYQLDRKYEKKFGLISRTILKNLLNNLGSASNINASDEYRLAPAFQRGVKYLNGLLAGAGVIDLKPDRVASSLSGKPGLGKVLVFYLPVNSNQGGKSGCIGIIREQDISIKRLLEFASNKTLFPGFTRSIIAVENSKTLIHDGLAKELLQFQSSSDGRIFSLGLPSQELLLRLITGGTLYPFNLKKVISKIPALRVTSPLTATTHPLRKIIAAGRTPVLILIILASMVILHIHFFGYAGNLRIRPRIFLSVVAASLLPFSTFIAATAYQQHFMEEFSRAEISQYIQMQTDQINKSLIGYLLNTELELTELARKLKILNHADSLNFLRNWLPTSAVAMVIFSRDNIENTITGQKVSGSYPFEQDVKNLFFSALKASLEPYSPTNSENKNMNNPLLVNAKRLSVFLENIGGTLISTISAYPGNVYSLFPVFPVGSNFAAPMALTMLRLPTRNLLSGFLESRPELLHNEIRGEYMVQNCFILQTSPTELPPENQAIISPEFPYETIRLAAEKVADTRSSTNWADGNSFNVVACLPSINCILAIKATRISDTSSIATHSMLQAVICFFLIVITVVIFLGKILVEPIDLLKAAASRVACGDYSEKIEFKSGDEFESLTEAFNGMSDSLLQKERLSSYVSAEVMHEVEATSGISLSPGGERIEVCVVFCSLAGFAEFRNNETHETVLAALGELIDTADIIATRNHGNIDKLVEDTLMLVFRQRGGNNTHVLAACRTALEICEVFKSSAGGFQIKAGIASGQAVSGKIGSSHGKLDFTVIGNPVNLAARLKVQAKKANQTGILICPNTIRKLKGVARVAFIERTQIKGLSRTFPLYELLEMRIERG